jgi:hypothetical protein
MALPIGAPDVPGMAYDRGRKLIAAPQIPQGGPGFAQIGMSNWPGQHPHDRRGPERPDQAHARSRQQRHGQDDVPREHDGPGCGSGVRLHLHRPPRRCVRERARPHTARAPRTTSSCSTSRTASSPIGFNALDGDPYLVTSQIMAIFDRLLRHLPDAADGRRAALDGADVRTQGLHPPRRPGGSGADQGGPAAAGRHHDRAQGPGPGRLLAHVRLLRPGQADGADRPRRAAAAAVRDVAESSRHAGTDGRTASTSTRCSHESKIILLNLKQGLIGEEEGRLFGSLFVTRFWNSVQRRSRLPEAQRKPYLLVVDEFQHYVNLPVSFSNVLAESRKYGLGFVLSHQMMGQLPHESARGGAHQRAQQGVFNVSAGDATLLAAGTVGGQRRGHAEPRPARDRDASGHRRRDHGTGHCQDSPAAEEPAHFGGGSGIEPQALRERPGGRGARDPSQAAAATGGAERPHCRG